MTLPTILSKIVAFTHSKAYTDFITHAPLAACIVLAAPKYNIYAFAAASTIGLWKNMLLDQKYQPDWNEHDAALAVVFYAVGAAVGMVIKCL